MVESEVGARRVGNALRRRMLPLYAATLLTGISRWAPIEKLDTVREETGSSDAFEKVLGRLRLVESMALVGSALLGAVLAELLSPRATYVLTLIPLALAALVLLRFREPRLHRPEEPEPFGRQLGVAYRTLLRHAARSTTVPRRSRRRRS